MIRSILLIVTLICCHGTGAASGTPAKFALEPAQVAERVWYFQGQSGMASRDNRGFMSNAGFVVTDDGVVVFDALATPALASAMLDAIRTITPQPVRRVIVSHYHADHVYGLQVFKQAGAEIWARNEGRIYLRSDLAAERLAQRRRDLSPWVDLHTELIRADRWLIFEDDAPQSFELGGMRFELLSGGDSHAPDDLMLWVPAQSVLFAGDLFFTGRLPFVVDGNTRQWLQALGRIDPGQARVVIPGHGPASTDVGLDLQVTRHYLQFLRRHMGEAAEALMTFEEAYAATDWSEFESLPTFEQANRRNAYTVFLEMQAEMLEPETAGP
ncbi:MBL fold metallo-hydrolase [Panacagrimonas sp.]|uniref:MBL fold metallo-hydrolase n=1 Tax=Panacagrimonas sp. TaxID=2480088 RepID=UPI003B51C222